MKYLKTDLLGKCIRWRQKGVCIVMKVEVVTETKVLPTDAKWEGVTYKEDKEEVVKSIKKLVLKGEYPNKLWK